MQNQSFHLIESLNNQTKKRLTNFLNQLLQKNSKSKNENNRILVTSDNTQLQLIFKNITQDFSILKAREASKNQRTQKLLSNNQYNYGEIEFRTFQKILCLLKSLELLKDGEQIFYDLGSGTGKVLLAASLCYSFKKCVGIEFLRSLYEVSIKLKQKILAQKEQIQQIIMNKQQNYSYVFPQLNIINSDFKKQDWSQATIVFASSTCYSPQLMKQLCFHSKKLKQGTIFITLTKKLEDYDTQHCWKCLQTLEGQTSWGSCTIYIQQKY